MSIRQYLLFTIFALLATAAFVGATSTSVSPTSGTGDTPITVSGTATYTPTYVVYAGSGGSCPATINPSSPPSMCTGVQLEDNPGACLLGSGGPVGGSSGYTVTLTGCVGTASSYNFCTYNNGGAGLSSATYTNTGGTGSCTTGWFGFSGVVSSQLCSIYTVVQTAIFVLGLLLMTLGGAVYVGSVILPGSSKGTLQGYAMGMLIGGVVGVIIALVSPYILSIIIGSSNAIC